MSSLTELLPLLREKCSGMLELQAIDALKKAYRIFCIESDFVQRNLVAVKDSNGSVALVPDIGYFINKVISVDDEYGRALTLGVDYKVDKSNRKLVLETRYSKVEVIYSIAPKLPFSPQLTIESDVLARWPDELASGAAAILRNMPNQPWTEHGLSQHYQQDFVKGYREAYRKGIAANDERQLQASHSRTYF